MTLPEGTRVVVRDTSQAGTIVSYYPVSQLYIIDLTESQTNAHVVRPAAEFTVLKQEPPVTTVVHPKYPVGALVKYLDNGARALAKVTQFVPTPEETWPYVVQLTPDSFQRCEEADLQWLTTDEFLDLLEPETCLPVPEQPPTRVPEPKPSLYDLIRKEIGDKLSDLSADSREYQINYVVNHLSPEQLLLHISRILDDTDLFEHYPTEE